MLMPAEAVFHGASGYERFIQTDESLREYINSFVFSDVKSDLHEISNDHVQKNIKWFPSKLYKNIRNINFHAMREMQGTSKTSVYFNVSFFSRRINSICIYFIFVFSVINF